MFKFVKMFSKSCLCLFIIYIGIIDAQNTSITISLNKSLDPQNSELYGDFIYLLRTSTVSVDFKDVNSNISFIIFQVHCHLHNVMLYKNVPIYSSTVYGTNIGLHSSVRVGLDKFYIYNQNVIDLKLYISVHGYRDAAPIPGGCNMVGSVPIFPTMMITSHKDYLNVDVSPPSKTSMSENCNENTVPVLFYRMYVSENNYDADKYFESIRNFITWDKIKQNGQRINKKSPLKFMRRIISAYPGTGTVYAAVIFSSDDVAVYVPSFSYACSPLDKSSCNNIDNLFSQFLCLMLIFIGIFICYFGHRFFKTEMFIVGMMSGIIVTYILISLNAELSSNGILFASVLSGLCFGAIWFLLWWRYGIPLVAVFLMTLNFGFIISCIVFYSVPDEVDILQDETNFWSLFILIMMVTSLISLPTTYISNILCCAMLGAYCTVYPIDFYLGSSLKYLVINTVRRAVVPTFKDASISPPCFWQDALVIGLWVFLAVTGFIFQHYHNRGKPPFPSVRRLPIDSTPPGFTYGTFLGRTQTRNINPNIENERTPLINQV